MSDDTFNYVVARRWYPDQLNSALAIYAYGSQVQSGTMDDAISFLEYVKFASRNAPEQCWSIYKVDFQKIAALPPS